MAIGAAHWMIMRVPAEARVDLGAIGDNIGLLRERVRGTEVMAMVKAEAYGHGLVEAAGAALAAARRGSGSRSSPRRCGCGTRASPSGRW